MKYIREIRFGPSKCGKTPAIIGSYPKPMLVFVLDMGGLDSIPAKGYIPQSTLPFKCDVVQEDIHWTAPEELSKFCTQSRESLPRVVALDFATMRMEIPNTLYAPIANKAGFNSFIDCLTTLHKVGCPFNTIVIDPGTGLIELVLAHIAGTNPNRMIDARKWAPDAGYQVVKVFNTMAVFKCHTVMIMHEDPQQVKDDTGAIVSQDIRPMCPSHWARIRLGGAVQQFLYQYKAMEKPQVLTQDFGNVKCGLGCRWPLGLPAKVGPLFQDIYGKEKMI